VDVYFVKHTVPMHRTFGLKFERSVPYLRTVLPSLQYIS